MRKHIIKMLVISILCCLGCEEKIISTNAHNNSTNVLEYIDLLENLPNEKERKDSAKKFFDNILDSSTVPYVADSLALFLYYGKANSVAWNGDFNSWSSDKNFSNNGKQVQGTNLWYLESYFPTDSRLDYKMTINESTWILDPSNPKKQWSGFGPNSVLAMHEYADDTIWNYEPNKKGQLLKSILLSEKLQYSVSYTIYLPYAYDSTLSNQSYPTLYVTDGHEYLDQQLGNMKQVLDALIDANKIEPMIVVFIDPRDPNELSHNRREQEYTLNPDFLAFVQDEMVPEIEEVYKLDSSMHQRGILGTSLGGLNASYFGAQTENFFKYIGIQSPAYWYKFSEIENLIKNMNSSNQKIYMSAGTFNDGLKNAESISAIYSSKNSRLKLDRTNQGHSWGAWKNQLDDLLLYFYAN